MDDKTNVLAILSLGLIFDVKVLLIVLTTRFDETVGQGSHGTI